MSQRASVLELVRGECTLVDPACALCGGRERRLRFRAGEHSVVTCSRCDLTYVTPRLTDQALLEEVYDARYWRSPAPRLRGYGDYLGEGELYLATFRRRLELLERHLGAPGRALDVGCAAGYFLQVLRERGWEVVGLEPSRTAREAAARALGVGVVRAGLLEAADLEAGSFDLVSLWDVIEHVPDPLALLARARDLLKPDGRLVLETQDVKSVAARLFGRRWQHYKHDEHLHHFHRGTLGAALGASGFSLLALSRAGAGKLVRREFLVERSARVAAWLPRLLGPFARLLPATLYVNPMDEWIAVARPRAEA